MSSIAGSVETRRVEAHAQKFFVVRSATLLSHGVICGLWPSFLTSTYLVHFLHNIASVFRADVAHTFSNSNEGAATIRQATEFKYIGWDGSPMYAFVWSRVTPPVDVTCFPLKPAFARFYRKATLLPSGKARIKWAVGDGSFHVTLVGTNFPDSSFPPSVFAHS